MKFTPNFSVSSSSSSSSSFSENYHTSKGNALGCFARVLSRILCSKILPTHPSDPIELDSIRNSSKLEDRILADGSATPNVIARLMGLDSMPEIKSNPLDFIQRSKSEENREKSEEIQCTHHRRIKTCVSFRETQDFFELEDDDFLVLTFENNGKIKKKGSNYGNCEVGIKGCKNQRRKCRRNRRRNKDEQGKDRVIFSDEERLSLKISSPIIETNLDVSKQSYHLLQLKDKVSGKKEGIHCNKARKKKKEKDLWGESKDEAEIDSENSSPVSVLDHNTVFITDLATSEEDARLRRRSECESVSRDYASESKDGNIERKVGLKRRDYNKHEYVEMLRKVFRLAETDVLNNSNCKYMWMLRGDDLEDTVTAFGQRIFDQLLTELLDQLLGFECNNHSCAIS